MNILYLFFSDKWTFYGINGSLLGFVGTLLISLNHVATVLGLVTSFIGLIVGILSGYKILLDILKKQIELKILKNSQGNEDTQIS